MSASDTNPFAPLLDPEPGTGVVPRVQAQVDGKVPPPHARCLECGLPVEPFTFSGPGGQVPAMGCPNVRSRADGKATCSDMWLVETEPKKRRGKSGKDAPPAPSIWDV